MRVIAGMYRGRQLRTVRGLSVRPATDRVKQTIFDLLMTRIDLQGARVLDLFAGSGSLGIEALSRGAGYALFVESNEQAATLIEENLSALGCLERSMVVVSDAMYVRGEKPFDLVFADPPYAFASTTSIPAMIRRHGLLVPGGYLMIEHASDTRFDGTEGFSIGPARTFGRTHVTFFRHNAP
jgi:16S rRNA (guanine966-N2)-methyltransferase